MKPDSPRSTLNIELAVVVTGSKLWLIDWCINVTSCARVLVHMLFQSCCTAYYHPGFQSSMPHIQASVACGSISKWLSSCSCPVITVHCMSLFTEMTTPCVYVDGEHTCYEIVCKFCATPAFGHPTLEWCCAHSRSKKLLESNSTQDVLSWHVYTSLMKQLGPDEQARFIIKI